MLFNFNRSYNKISPKDAKEMMDSNGETLVLDVRESDEYKSGHIPGSKNIPVGHLHSVKNRLPENKEAPIITYCLSGARAVNACSVLSSFGYKNVYCMGGIFNWPYGIE